MKSALGRWALVLLGLIAVSPDVRAADGRLSYPESGAGWLQVRTGLSFADALTLDQGSIGLASTGDPGMVLGVGFHWRTSRLDFGAQFESASSWTFAGIGRANRVGAQHRVSANLRWRYIEDTWGALFLGLSPGLSVFSHAAPLRFQVSQLNGSADIADTHTLGFSFGFDFGILVYLTDELALALHLDLITSSTALDTDRGEVDLDMVRGIFALGLEWRM